MSSPARLARRWRALWPAEKHTAAGEVFNELAARYAEPHRAYHTLEHVAYCLRWLDEVRSLLARPVEAELALWFHDAVYDSRRGDNEARSAQLAAGALAALGLADDATERVAALIRLTDHRAADLRVDEALVCDVDLTILGAELDVFAAYDAAIRREYSWVPDDAYRRGRGQILAGFVARPRIYHTQFFHNLLERTARENLRRALRHYDA